MNDTPSMDVLAAIYLKMREKKSEMTKAYEAEVAVLESKMQAVSTAMKDMLVATGGTSLKTPHGTVYLSKKERFYAQDRSAFNDWVLRNGAVDLYENRIAQGNMKKWLEDNPTNPPPGLQSESEVVAIVRKN